MCVYHICLFLLYDPMAGQVSIYFSMEVVTPDTLHVLLYWLNFMHKLLKNTFYLYPKSFIFSSQKYYFVVVAINQVTNTGFVGGGVLTGDEVLPARGPLGTHSCVLRHTDLATGIASCKHKIIYFFKVSNSKQLYCVD